MMRTAGLSKNLKEALQRLATPREIKTMSEQLADRLELEQAQVENPVEFELSPETEIDWSEGVEHLRAKTPEDLYKMLGLEKHTIPFFREEIETEPAGEEGELESTATATEGLELRWHQLVGLTKMVERAMKSEPVLLMDDVGLGKTIQVLALFAMLAYYRSIYAATGKYPGIWGKRRLVYREIWANELTYATGSQEGGWTTYEGRPSVLPDYPFMFVVPPTLVDQVVVECVRFLKPGSFDVIKITGANVKHKDVWEEADKRSAMPPHMRLYVASTTVSTNLYELRTKGTVTKCTL